MEQQNSERNKNVVLVRFDEQIGKKEFTAFLRVHAKEFISVIETTIFLKGRIYIFDKVLDSDHFEQYQKHSLCKKFDEILYKICMKYPQIKHFYNKTLPAALISRKEAA